MPSTVFPLSTDRRVFWFMSQKRSKKNVDSFIAGRMNAQVSAHHELTRVQHPIANDQLQYVGDNACNTMPVCIDFSFSFLYHFLSLSRYSDAVQAKLNIDVFVLHNYSNSVWYFVLLFMSCRRPLLPSLERLLSFYAVCVEKYVTACLSLFHEILMINVNFLWHVYSLPFKFLMRRKNLWVTGFRLYLKNFASLKFLLDFPKHFVVFSLFFKLHWKSYLYLICYGAVFLLLVFVNTI